MVLVIVKIGRDISRKNNHMNVGFVGLSEMHGRPQVHNRVKSVNLLLHRVLLATECLQIAFTDISFIHTHSYTSHNLLISVDKRKTGDIRVCDEYNIRTPLQDRKPGSEWVRNFCKHNCLSNKKLAAFEKVCRKKRVLSLACI